MSEDRSVDEVANEGQRRTIDLNPVRLEIPIEWTTRSIDSLSDIVTDGAHQTPEYVDNGVRFLSTKNLKPGQQDFDFSDYEKFITEQEYSELCTRVDPQYGDILISKSGTIGITQLVRKNFDFNIFVGLALIRPTDEVDSVYLEQVLNWKQIRKTMRARSPGSTRSTLPIFATKRLEIPFPPLEEQRKIASVLYTVDQAIWKTEEIIEQINRVKQGVLQHYFEDFSTIRRAENPDSVEMVELSDLVEFKPGKAWKTDNLSDGGLKVVRISNLTGHKDDYWRYDGEYEERRVIRDGDLLFSWAGMKSSIGVHIYHGEKALLNQHIYNLIPKSHIKREYLYYYLDYRMNDLYSLSQGGAVQIHLTKDIIENILIPNMEKDMRDSIVTHLSKIDAAIRNEKAQKNQLQRLKQGLMQDLLSGEVRTHDKNIKILDEVIQHG